MFLGVSLDVAVCLGASWCASVCVCVPRGFVVCLRVPPYSTPPCLSAYLPGFLRGAFGFGGRLEPHVCHGLVPSAPPPCDAGCRSVSPCVSVRRRVSWCISVLSVFRHYCLHKGSKTIRVRSRCAWSLHVYMIHGRLHIRIVVCSSASNKRYCPCNEEASVFAVRKPWQYRFDVDLI